MNNWGQEDLSSPTPSTYNNMAASPLGGMGGVAPAANAGAPQQAPYAGANQNLLAEQSFEAPPAVDPSMQPSPMAAQAADAFMNPQDTWSAPQPQVRPLPPTAYPDVRLATVSPCFTSHRVIT